jgi:vacuolar protein sorting-associated protein 13A/C
MFESLVANLLNRVLGSYIENFDPKQLNIGIWSGAVKLRNLKLKKESLDKFKLPIDVKLGHLGELSLIIPWSNLKSKPVQIVIEDVYILVSPFILQEYDQQQEYEREQAIKREKLIELESVNGLDEVIEENVSSNESFTESLVTKIVDNFQITIKNIHVRYEDDDVLTEEPYAVGITLNELSGVSADSNWIPSFISITQAFTRKLLTLKHLSCYMKTNSKTIYTDNLEDLLAKFKDSIVNDDETDFNDQFLLKPVTGSGKVTVHKKGTMEGIPHIKSEFFFKEFGVALDSQQYQNILWTASKLHWFIKTQKFRKLRPKVTPQKDPKLWFQYAAKSVLQEIHERNYKWSWEYFKTRRDQRLAYVKLWEKKSTIVLSDEEESELKNLEDELSFDDIRFYRSLAKKEIRKQKLAAPKVVEKKQELKSGWFESWWSGSSNQLEKPEVQNDDLQLTSDQRKALYDTIEYDEKEEVTNAIDIPRDRVKLEILASLEKGGISIKRKESNHNLAEVIFEGCTAQLYQRPDSLLTKFQLQEFRVEDGTGSSLYKHIVSVKQLHSNLHSLDVKIGPFFQISFEQNPLDGSADSVLLGKLNSMTIFYNPKLIEEVIIFFTPPKMYLETVGAIMNAAEVTMEGITNRTRIGLQYALEEHKTINVKLDLQAPLIILPLEPSNYKSPVAILDAGHISVVSDLVEKDKIEENKAKEHYTTEDMEKLNSFMYDQFSLRLQDAKFCVGPDIRTTMEELHDGTKAINSTTILDRFDIKLLFGVSILPKAYNLSRFKISAEVPKLSLKINDFQYKTLLQIIDKVIPNLEDSDSDAISAFSTYGTTNENNTASNKSQSEYEDEKSFIDEAGDNTQSAKNELMLKQHLFDFVFKVKLTKLSLFRCIDGASLKEEKLVDLIGDDLALNLFKTANDLNLLMSLKDLYVLDFIESSGVPEFEKLISSNVSAARGKESKELLKVNYLRNLRIVEYNGKEIEVFDQDIKVDVSVVKFVITRKSILSILNFILNTFTDPIAEPTPADELNHNDFRDELLSPQRINVNVNLDSIILVLNEDGIKLATLKLSTANFSVFLVPEELEVKGKLGALILHDEINQGSPRDSQLRKLISIDGANLAEFYYKTFDPQKKSTLYDSAIDFKTNSIRINFVESSFARILSYLNKFLKMKAVYDNAREAAINQASKINYDEKIKFNILLKAPKIIFPRLSQKYPAEETKLDSFISNLGELYASNEFEKDSENGSIKNIINAGIRNISLETCFNFEEVEQHCDIAEDIDISFKMEYLDGAITGSPQFNASGRAPEIDLNLTETQLKYLKYLSDSLSRSLNFDAEEDDDTDMDEIELDAVNANAVAKYNSADLTNKRKELETPESDQSPVIVKRKCVVAFSFLAPRLSLTIYDNTENIKDISKNKVAWFALNELVIEINIDDSGKLDSKVRVRSFQVKDVRDGSTTKFEDLIPTKGNDFDQLDVSISSESHGKSDLLSIMLTIDNVSLILALDYVFELQNFFNKGLARNETELDDEDKSDGITDGNTKKRQSSIKNSVPNDENTSKDSQMSIGYSINIKNPSVTLLADPSNTNTEACVFEVEQVLMTSQSVISVAAKNIGMYMGWMGELENKNYRIIDDFSISFAHNSRGSTANSLLTSIDASIDALLVRVSLKDIRLAVTVFNNATEAFNKRNDVTTDNEDSNSEYKFSQDFKRRLAQYAPSILTNKSLASASKTPECKETSLIINGEELSVNFGGVRFVLIGDVHELPVLDMNVKPFEIKAKNWSSEMNAEVHLEQYINIYNYAYSTWEPLVEPWLIAVYVTKLLKPEPCVSVDFVSRKLAEVTITSRAVALLSQISNLITTDLKLKSRGEDKPYVIINETGFDIEIWPANKSEEERVKSRMIIKNCDEAPWAFEDWTENREHLDSDPRAKAVLGLSLLNSEYESIQGISTIGEGEELFMLYPPIDGVHNRLSCEITLREDNIKSVIFKSTITVRNSSDVGIVVEVAKKYSDTRQVVVNPNSSTSLPIDFVYSGRLRIKPILELAYNWSQESLNWADLLNGETSINCLAENGNKSAYYFHVEAKFNKVEPLSKIYPHMKIIVSAPVEIENLLPFDLCYRLYDKNNKRDWNGSIEKGVKSYVHVVTLESLLLLSVHPVDCGYERSEFAVINSTAHLVFKVEKTLRLKHEDGLTLWLNIHYARNENEGSSLKIIVYAPYVILNKTEQNLLISPIGSNRPLSSMGKLSFKPEPTMFSFEKDGDTKNRVAIKIGDSNWTSPISFDSLGQPVEAKAQVIGKQIEKNVGVSVLLGEGKYHMSKVVTVSPRYIFRNLTDEAIQIVENGSTNPKTVESNAFIPMYDLRRFENKSILVKFLHSSKTWSSPFSIVDVGQLFVKVYKENVGQVLLKVNVLIEKATIFILVENANEEWPFSIRNFSDSEFYIYQGDPNINENGEVVRTDTQYKPVYYKIPPRSVMPYAYDYPNAMIKELYIRSHGRERTVNLAEIGNLKPFRLPQTPKLEQVIVDLNVVADGPTISLIISNHDTSLSLYKLKESSNSTTDIGDNYDLSADVEEYQMRVITKFEGFGISLINTRSQELCYISLRGFEVRYNEFNSYQNLSVKIKWIQIDNQLFGGIFPIVLYPSVIPKSGREMTNHPAISGSICTVKGDSHGVIFVKFATILLQEMAIEIDEDFLFALLDFAKFPGASWNGKQKDVLYDGTLELPEPLSLGTYSDVYFEGLHLQPTQLNLSFVRTERVNAEDKANSQSAVMFFFDILTMAIGNINDAPIKLNALFLENLRVPIPFLLESIKSHYSQAFFYQIHRVLGSADVLGNPVGLFKNLSSGVADIFYEPYQGFVVTDRPQELGIGLAKGGLSFLKKTVFGLSDSFAKFSGSIAKGLSVATLDSSFQERRRRNQHRNRPKHALYGIASGANSFFDSLASGVSGVATAPIEGASTGGASGFFKGLGKGVIGLPTKTAIGFFDLASNLSEGIRNTTTVFDVDALDKVRLPRYIPSDGVIQPYVQREAQGLYWLKTIDNGAFFNETYLAHMVLSGQEMAVLVTYKMIILFQINKLTTKWVITFENISAVTAESTGISLILKKRNGPFIPIPEKMNRTFLYNSIAVAVKEYNKPYQVEL